MSELTATLNKSVENAAKKLLIHFKEQYGAMIFIPLGVSETTTPAKIVPSVVPAFEQSCFVVGQSNSRRHARKSISQKRRWAVAEKV